MNPTDIKIDWENIAEVFKSVVLEMSTEILKLEAKLKLIESIQDKIKLLPIKTARLKLVILM